MHCEKFVINLYWPTPCQTLNQSSQPPSKKIIVAIDSTPFICLIYYFPKFIISLWQAENLCLMGVRMDVTLPIMEWRATHYMVRETKGWVLPCLPAPLTSNLVTRITTFLLSTKVVSLWLCDHHFIFIINCIFSLSLNSLLHNLTFCWHGK